MRRLLAVAAMAALSACTGVSSDMGMSPVYTQAMMMPVSAPRFGDRHPVTWKSISPARYAVHGTDVSKYQTDVNWDTARKSGISFVFVKATEGGDRIDSSFGQHWNEARSAGVPRGAYHFFYFCRPASEQAAWFIRNVPRERGMLPPVLDIEWNPSSPTCKLRPAPEKVRSEMAVFLRIVAKHYGQRPIIYTTPDFFDRNDLAGMKGYPFWLRSTAAHPDDRYNHPFVFWQYTGTGIVPGLRGDADINAFNGSEREWRSWLKSNLS